jgi:hypothetical protein
LRENVLKIVLNEVKGQRTNIRIVYKINLNVLKQENKTRRLCYCLAKESQKYFKEISISRYIANSSLWENEVLQRLDEKNHKYKHEQKSYGYQTI